MQKVVATRPARNAKPRLGQHFLVDDAAAQQIVEALGDVSRRTVMEVGPGRGALTSLLAARARRVIAVELDRVLAAQLRMHLALVDNVEIIEGDILAVDFKTLFGPKPGSARPGIAHKVEPVRVVGNLPYFITSDILLRFFAHRQYFETLVLMVQREVADRLAAAPGGSDYGLLRPRRSCMAGWRNCSRFRRRPSLRRPKCIPLSSGLPWTRRSNAWLCRKRALSTS